MLDKIKNLRQLLGYGLLGWRLFQDPRVSLTAKVVVFLAVLAAFSPLDLLDWLPFAPGAGTIALLILALRLFANAAPDEVREEHMQALGIRTLS